MFLLERIMGIATYLIVLLLTCNGIAISKDSNGIRRCMVFAVVILTIMAFFYVPAPQADLSRLIQYMHDWSMNDLEWLISRCSGTSTPMWMIYFWLIGKCGVDGLLPAITALIYYFLILSCFWTYASKENISPKATSLAFLFFMSYATFLEAISGIRSSLVFAVFFWCIFREAVLGKSPLAHLPLYTVAALMHPVGMAVLLLRFIMLSFQKSAKRSGRLAYLLISVIAIGAIIYFGQGYLDNMLAKADVYVSNDVYGNTWETAVHLILILASILTLLQVRKLSLIGRASKSLTNIAIFATVLAAISILGIFLNYAIFHRFSSFLGMFIAVEFMGLQKTAARQESSFSQYMTAMRLCMFLMLGLACARGNLCAYKFMVLS